MNCLGNGRVSPSRDHTVRGVGSVPKARALLNRRNGAEAVEASRFRIAAFSRRRTFFRFLRTSRRWRHTHLCDASIGLRHLPAESTAAIVARFTHLVVGLARIEGPVATHVASLELLSFKIERRMADVGSGGCVNVDRSHPEFLSPTFDCARSV